MAGRKQTRLKLATGGKPPRRHPAAPTVSISSSLPMSGSNISSSPANSSLAVSFRSRNLQEITGFSRTPVHQAVSRLADDTLILIRPRHGVQIAPIDLARERMLLHLRRDIERFVIRLAAERSGPSHRNQFLHIERLLRERRDSMTVEEFNVLDRRIDKLILAVAGEPFLEHTVRPLHTIFRRIGWVHHRHIRGMRACRPRSIATSPSSMPSPTGTSTTRWPHPMPSSISLTACLCHGARN